MADESVVDVDKSKGSNTFDVKSAETGGSLTSMADKEKITDNVNDMVTVTPINSGVDTGSAQLGGTMNALINQSGNSSSGAFQLTPESGNDKVDLTGQYQDKKVVQTNGINPNTGQGYPSFPDGFATQFNNGGNSFQVGPDIVPNSATITTKLTDKDIVIDEKDTDTAGQVAIGAITYKDNPSVTTTTALTYAALSSNPQGINLTVLSANSTDTDTQSEKESVTGGSAPYQTTMTSSDNDSTTYDWKIVAYWSGQSESSVAHITSNSNNGDTITGTEGGTTPSDVVDVTTGSSFLSGKQTLIFNDFYQGDAPTFWKETLTWENKSNNLSKEQSIGTSKNLLEMTSLATTFGLVHGIFKGPEGSYTVHIEGNTKNVEGLQNGEPTDTKTYNDSVRYDGTNPANGDSVNYYSYTDQNSKPAVGDGDWFEQLSNFSTRSAIRSPED